jgi:hypothetical protein
MEDTTRGTVTVQVDGKPYTGAFTVTEGRVPIVWVSLTQPPLSGYRSTSLGEGSAQSVAELLLRELVVEAREKGWIRD